VALLLTPAEAGYGLAPGGYRLMPAMRDFKRSRDNVIMKRRATFELVA